MRTRLLVAAAVTAIVIAGCSTASNASPAASGAPPSVAPTSGPPSAAAMQKINFVLDWTPNPFQNFVYAADKNGYYKDAGLDVSIAIPDSAIGSLQMIGTKKADIGLSVSTDGIIGHTQGVPVTVVGEVLPGLQEGVMALGDRVKQFSDIKGQQVGIIQSDYDRICFNRLLAKNSLAPTDVSIVDPGFNLVTPLVTNKLIMTTGAGSGERVIAAETAKKEIKFWDLATGAEVPYSVEKASAEAGLCPRIFIVILANTEWLKANPDTAKAFLAATMKGLKWAIENEDAAAAIFANLHPESQKDIDKIQWQHLAPLFCDPVNAAKGFGYNNLDTWNQVLKMYEDEKLIKSTFPIEELVTNDYVPSPPVTSSVCGS